MDQKDLFTFFLTLKKQYSEDEIPRILEMYEITKLDVNRIYRYLDKKGVPPGGQPGGQPGVPPAYDGCAMGGPPPYDGCAMGAFD